MTDIPEFATRTPYKNYLYLLKKILSQIETDEVFFGDHDDNVKNEIKNYIVQMKYSIHYTHFLESIYYLLEFLEKTLLNKEFNFKDFTEEDYNLYLSVRSKLYKEIEYRELVCQCDFIDINEHLNCWTCGVIECGCKADPMCCGKKTFIL